jgi:hypothetical protein
MLAPIYNMSKGKYDMISPMERTAGGRKYWSNPKGCGKEATVYKISRRKKLW